MALHRDIFWVGRQWAVTGYGIQACDQKQKGNFDIEASRLWEDALLQDLRSQKWLNIEDFDKALAIARARYPAPPDRAGPLPEPVAPLRDGGPIALPKPAAQEFHMRIVGWPAKLVAPWRIGVRR